MNFFSGRPFVDWPPPNPEAERDSYRVRFGSFDSDDSEAPPPSPPVDYEPQKEDDFKTWFDAQFGDSPSNESKEAQIPKLLPHLKQNPQNIAQIIILVPYWLQRYGRHLSVSCRAELVSVQALRAYVAENDDAYLYEIGDHFSVDPSTVFYALKKLKITLKKKPRVTKSAVKS
jgi:hypothetical protein